MSRVSSNGDKPVDQERLRRELLKLIVRNEASRRDQRKAPGK